MPTTLQLQYNEILNYTNHNYSQLLDNYNEIRVFECTNRR